MRYTSVTVASGKVYVCGDEVVIERAWGATRFGHWKPPFQQQRPSHVVPKLNGGYRRGRDKSA